MKFRVDILSALFLCLTFALAVVGGGSAGQAAIDRAAAGHAAKGGGQPSPQPAPAEFKRLFFEAESQAAGTSPGQDEGKAALAPAGHGMLAPTLVADYVPLPSAESHPTSRRAYGARAPPTHA
jgi:hypothetical protein